MTEADYATIEARLLTLQSEQPHDLHRQTAAEVLGVPEDEVSPTGRRLGKAINFYHMYGPEVRHER